MAFLHPQVGRKKEDDVNVENVISFQLTKESDVCKENHKKKVQGC